MTIILMGKRGLVALLSLSSWFLVVVVWLFLAVPWVCLRFVIVVLPDHTHFFVTFVCGILGQVWYLIVLIPDLCLLSYFVINK